jgi:hypothetical protein
LPTGLKSCRTIRDAFAPIPAKPYQIMWITGCDAIERAWGELKYFSKIFRLHRDARRAHIALLPLATAGRYGVAGVVVGLL